MGRLDVKGCFMSRAYGKSRLGAGLSLGVLLAGLGWTLLSGVTAQADWFWQNPLPATPAVALNQISADPYADSPCQHQTEVEPDTFAYAGSIVSALQVGRCFDGGASNIGWATSTDNGLNWQSGFLPGLTVVSGGTYARASDPSVAFDAAHGVWMVSSLGIDANTRVEAVVLSRSNDGINWDPPVTIYAVTSSEFPDKNWTACDNTPTSPFYGNCYTEWDDNSIGNRIEMQTSIDGGLTWAPPVETANSATGLGGQPVVQPGGRVIVPIANANASAILSFFSDDGGLSWSPTVIVSPVFRHGVAGGLRSLALPSAEIDASGNVYVAWQDCRFRTGCSSNDIVIASSEDGVVYSAVTQVPIDDVASGVDHFIPGLAVDRSTAPPTAHVGLAYYFYPNASCSSSTCQLMAGYIASPDGGATWFAPVTLTDAPMSLSWLASTNQGVMVGDYISTSHAANGTAYPVFAVAKAPHPDPDEAMYTPAVGLSAGPATRVGAVKPAGRVSAAAQDGPPLSAH